MTLPIIFLIAMNLAKSKNGPEHALSLIHI